MSDERWTSRVQGLLRGDDGRVLVLGSGQSRTLPYIELEGYADDELPSVRDAIATLVGIPTVVVRPVARTVHKERRMLEIALELEPQEALVDLPPGTAWLGRDDLAGFSLPSRDRELVDRLSTDRPPPERPQWAFPGWFAEATDWIESTLVELGRRPVGPVEQISNWCMSSILRNQAVSYRSILENVEPDTALDLESMLPYWLRKALAADPETRRS
jgi:hypothetical protein